MERQWVQLLKGSQDEMAQRHNSLCSHIGVVLNNQSELLKELQWKQHLMEENERNKLAQRVGNKKTESFPCPSPVDPVSVQPRSRSEPTRGRRIEAEPPLYTFAPLGTSLPLDGQIPLPSGKSLQPSDKSKSRSVPGKLDSKRENPSGIHLGEAGAGQSKENFAKFSG
jgi:hypothetical protein